MGILHFYYNNISFSENIVYSLDYSLFYFRFIIFTHFIIYLLINIPKLTNLLIKGILISFFVMIIYSTIELILYTQMGHIDGLMRRLHLLFQMRQLLVVLWLGCCRFYVFLLY